MSFVALGVNLPLAARRAIFALGFGVIGFVVALTGLNDAGAKYESFLLVIAYWIGPWLAVVFTDQALRRGQPVEQFLYDKRYANWAGPIAMLTGMLVSILLFSNQTQFVGYVARQSSSFGDIAFEVGFVVAAVTYYLPARTGARDRPGPTADPTADPTGGPRTRGRWRRAVGAVRWRRGRRRLPRPHRGGATGHCGRRRRCASCTSGTWPRCRSRTSTSTSACRSSSTRTAWWPRSSAGRGGFCYELNGAFALLLRALGFEVDAAVRRGVRARPGSGPPFDHLALRVDLDRAVAGRRRLRPAASTRCGCPTRGDQADPGGTFRLVDADRRRPGRARATGRPQYRRGGAAAPWPTIAPTCWWQQTWPGSHFRTGPVASLQTADGQVTVAGRTLIRTVGTERTETALGTDAEVLAAYREHFGIGLDRVPEPQAGLPSRPAAPAAAAAIARILPSADSRGRYFMPQSGASTTRSASTYGSARRTRSATVCGRLDRPGRTGRARRA